VRKKSQKWITSWALYILSPKMHKSLKKMDKGFASFKEKTNSLQSLLDSICNSASSLYWLITKTFKSLVFFQFLRTILPLQFNKHGHFTKIEV